MRKNDPTPIIIELGLANDAPKQQPPIRVHIKPHM